MKLQMSQIQTVCYPEIFLHCVLACQLHANIKIVEIPTSSLSLFMCVIVSLWFILQYTIVGLCISTTCLSLYKARSYTACSLILERVVSWC